VHQHVDLSEPLMNELCHPQNGRKTGLGQWLSDFLRSSQTIKLKLDRLTMPQEDEAKSNQSLTTLIAGICVF
jgi:hypothetical protein